MVGETIVSAGRQALRALRDDLTGFMALSADPWSIESGLYTYNLSAEFGRRRLHLRVAGDGQGVLFVDVTDVIHLNPTAAAMAKLALEGLSEDAARSRLLAHVRPSERKRLSQDLQGVYDMIYRFQAPTGECPTCAVSSLENAPLFSVAAEAPYKADLALTYGCNNACGHCYNEPDRFAMPSLAAEEWRSVLDKLHDVGVPHVIFTGGEATLHPDLPELIHYAESLGLVTGLNTNGRRIAHRPYMDTLASAGLNHVQVTLASNRPAVHDAIMGARAFEQTVRGIENAISSGVHCITNTTLMDCNKDHVAEIIHYLHELGIRTFAMNGMIYSGGGLYDPNAIPEVEMAPLLIRIRDLAADLGMRFLWYTPTEYCRLSPVELEIGAKRCNAAEYSICIEPSGDVLPCQSYYVAAGNILRDPWKQIWHDPLFHSFRDRNDDPRTSGLPEKCWGCPDLPLCGGGCRLEREAQSRIISADLELSRPATNASKCAVTRPPNGSDSASFTPSPGATNGRNRAQGGQLDILKRIDNSSIEYG